MYFLFQKREEMQDERKGRKKRQLLSAKNTADWGKSIKFFPGHLCLKKERACLSQRKLKKKRGGGNRAMAGVRLRLQKRGKRGAFRRLQDFRLYPGEPWGERSNFARGPIASLSGKIVLTRGRE